MTYWIQRADFFSTDHAGVSTPEAVDAFEHHDWATELDFEAGLREAGADHCRPGIGYVSPTGEILHLCPGMDHVQVHYHYHEARRILGVFPVKRSKSLSVPSLPKGQAAQLIQLFTTGQWAALRQQLEHATR